LHACLRLESLKPYVVTSHDSPKLQQRLKTRGVRFGTNFVLKSRGKSDINAEIFSEDIRTVFIPNLNELRSLEQFARAEAVLLIDNCPSHVAEVLLDLLLEAGVRVITWPPHTTQIFYELDMSLFGVLKRREQYKLPFDDDQGTAIFLLWIYRAFKQIMIETNIWAAFQPEGFEFDVNREPYRLRFDEEKLRSRPAFQEIWSLDFPLEKLSVRRQPARFGWINQLE
jgi:hypothetical protein